MTSSLVFTFFNAGIITVVVCVLAGIAYKAIQETGMIARIRKKLKKEAK